MSAAAMTDSVPLLTVDDLVLDFRTRSGTVHVLDGISLTLERGEILGIVGESGSGKSVLAYAMMGLLDPAARVPRGGIRFAGRNMLTESERALAETRGREIAMIFQSPRTALNPIRRVGTQVQDVLLRHANVSKKEARTRAIEALARVRIPDPERRFDAYPFELSGGLCQRVMIAMAMACNPYLLIADEPTTGLDVTTQAVVMDLIRDQVRSANASVVLITHDLALAGEYCDRIAVIHAGHIVEIGSTEAMLDSPKHPYTARLIGATPGGHESIDDLASIPGSLPDLRRDLPPCRFIDRCDRKLDRCAVDPLPAVAIGADHLVRCWNPL
ncbi:ABC transporter ATP-binding protein [Acidisoma silvae]|uniref:ABC transporter ATP-binding protein n=1 Tax=Acidisoma silvae TaxID=2802396 RepID=A0A963YTL4_9PROT|nr:ABC transporter ATP-binding protein [Acidisoma silvae]MCB8876805.1 ABC transporter ATP-binding protein [Acidisoma silvae]